MPTYVPMLIGSNYTLVDINVCYRRVKDFTADKYSVCTGDGLCVFAHISCKYTQAHLASLSPEELVLICPTGFKRRRI